MSSPHLEVSPLRLRREAAAGNGRVGSPAPAWASCGVGFRCDRCSGLFCNNDVLELHHLVYHAATELVDSDTTSKWWSSNMRSGGLIPTATSNEHPRCIADGNELLQFHGTTVSCSLGSPRRPSL
ncbi:uncharacterized protein LOC120685045 [Panicum virgatum]|uniref:C2H2-type domain-containing protein n=1 Tax=Panicum virgatum TaxID=38727 RepID=A0A8T0PIY8_PANVG|nr:uncharacterized protein LOC120685045 [Panicum virgatum]KAG2558304.1 hypothetical protein PVAP13_8NG115600 [Panicum virgatum]